MTKVTRKSIENILSFLLILTMLAGMTTAFAASITGTANDMVKISAERSGDEIVVHFTAIARENILGLGFFYQFDEKTSYVSYNPNSTVFNGTREINTASDWQKVGLAGTGQNWAQAGDDLVSFTFRVNDGFKPDTDYTFSLKMDSVFDNDYQKYSWTRDTFTVTYAEHTVTFYDEDGTTVLDNSQNNAITGDAVVYSKDTPTKASDEKYTYTFKGWATAVGADVSEARQISELPTVGSTSVAYYAVYDKTPIEYTITYELDNGALAEGVTNPTTYTVESNAITLNNPTRTGYVFAGWTGTDLTAATTSVTIPTGSTGNRAYTATWTPADVTYTVKHFQQDLDGVNYTEINEDQQILSGTTGGQTAAEAKTYGGFTAQTVTQETIAADSSTVVVIKYDRNKHNVTYVVTGDAPTDATVPAQQTDILYGAPITVADTLTTNETTNAGIPGVWAFSGWDRTESFAMPDENVTITGIWTFTATTYTVKWVDENGTVLETDENVAYGSMPSYDGATPTKAATADTTYTFAGWTPKIIAVTGDATYTATYSGTTNIYTIKWVDGNGNTLKTEALAYGAIPAYDGITPTKTASDGKTYTFNGNWSPAVEAVTGNATYTAQFDETTNAYTITWKMDDGSIIDTTVVNHGDTPTHTEPAKAADADNTYAFSGWTPTIVPATGVATYTAQFTATPIPTYTITFQDENGTVLSTTTVKEGEMPAYTGNILTKAEDDDYTYSFSGWSPTIVPATSNATYTAQYLRTEKDKYNLTDPVLPDPSATPEPTPTPETVTITWLNYDGSLIEQTTVGYGEKPTHEEPVLAPMPEEEGKTYTFSGWSPEIVAATGDATYIATFKDESENPVPTPTPVVAPENPDNDPTNHEDPASITTKGHTYEVYQIFTGDYYHDQEHGKDILTNLVWGANGNAGTKEVTTVDEEGNETKETVNIQVGDPVAQSVLDALSALVNETLDRKKLDEIEKYVNIDGKPFKTITLGEGDTENTIQLPAGYYLIRDVAGSQNGKDDAYTTYITVVIKDYTIQPKSVIPTVDKQVWDNNDAPNGGNREGWAETADHAINESFQFALIGTIPNNTHLKDYTNGYTVKFTDTMSAGVTFESIESVTVDGKDVDASKYSFSGVKNNSWTISMDVRDIIGAETFGTGDAGYISVIVIYNAHLNDNAIVHTASETPGETNRNTVYMEYSNNPNTDGEDDMGRTEEDSVWVFTYEIRNKKVDGSNNPLAGAGFTLYQGETAIKLIKGSDGTYVVADQNAAEGTVTEMLTDSTGLFNVKGLDAGTYTLRETTTPAGYNSCPDTTVTINASHEETPDGTKANLYLSGQNQNNTIINQSGAELPSTGGIGTTIFYVAGSVLVLFAGVLLVTKKRMEHR